MGKSKKFREGPGWQGMNTNRGDESAYSTGGGVKAEGTHQSGPEDYGRKGMKHSARSKTTTGPADRVIQPGKYTGYRTS